jgi:hypothetical protein
MESRIKTDMGDIMPLHPLAKDLPEEHIALAPEFHSPAVARCCQAWNRAFKSHLQGGANPVSVHLRANEAYRNAMPPLSTPQTSATLSPALHTAGVASRAFKLAASIANTTAPRVPAKNKISGCETVGWNFAGLKTTTRPEESFTDRTELDPNLV